MGNSLVRPSSKLSPKLLRVVTFIMNSFTWRNVLCCLLCAFSWMASRQSTVAQPPNFLVIIADDMGYSDAGCYGGEIATPNLDALAAGGLRFTQFYNTARCWPTRSALLSGYYPQQIRRDAMPGVNPKEYGGSGVRPAWAQLISQRLQSLGYRTYHSGKWHIDGQPTDNGFDLSDQVSRGPGFFEGKANRQKLSNGNNRKLEDSQFYLTTATAQHAIDCLKEHAAKFSQRPFFHYLAFNAPHFPLHALPEDIARYQGRYVVGWDQLRRERHARQVELGISQISPSLLEAEVGPPYDFPDQIELLGPGETNRPVPWSDLSDQQKQFQATKMSIHAAMIDRMDREIGRVLDQLRAMNALDNTFICFLSDNGASAEIMVRGDGHDPSASPGSADTYLCLGPGFSSAANTPFRRHKTWVHEGGISTPFIVHWPNGIAHKNELRNSVAHVIDISPTILELAGGKVTPKTDVPVMPGKSLTAALTADSPQPLHEELWFYHEGNRGLRQGDWKIVLSPAVRTRPQNSTENENSNSEPEEPWELYNLANDRGEQHNLAAQYPERVHSMAQRWTKMKNQFQQDSR